MHPSVAHTLRQLSNELSHVESSWHPVGVAEAQQIRRARLTAAQRRVALRMARRGLDSSQLT